MMTLRDNLLLFNLVVESMSSVNPDPPATGSTGRVTVLARPNRREQGPAAEMLQGDGVGDIPWQPRGTHEGAGLCRGQ